MNRARLIEILATELTKAGLHESTAEHIAALRTDKKISPGLEAALSAMERAVMEDRDPLA